MRLEEVNLGTYLQRKAYTKIIDCKLRKRAHVQAEVIIVALYSQPCLYQTMRHSFGLAYGMWSVTKCARDGCGASHAN
jgi:hypothetical protein